MQNDRYFVGGAEAFIALYDSSNAIGPRVSMGDCEVFSPTVAPTTIERFSAVSGVRRLAARRVTEVKEEYTLTMFDVKARRNLAYLLSADLQSYTQAATPLTSIAHDAHGPGTVIALRDATGKHMMPITSVQTVANTAGTTTYVAGTDYLANADDLKFGVIRIPDGSAIAIESVNISFTPAAITDENRLFYPLSVPILKGNVILVWKEGGPDGTNDFVAVRTGNDDAAGNLSGFDTTITQGAVSLSATDFSSFELVLSAIADVTNPSKPVGRMVIPVGGF